MSQSPRKASSSKPAFIVRAERSFKRVATKLKADAELHGYKLLTFPPQGKKST